MLEERQKNSAVSVPKIIPKGIIEDIFADVGRYIPVGVLEEGEDNSDTIVADSERERENTSAMTGSVVETGKAKGLFSNLLPSFPSKIRMTETTEPSPKSITAKSNAACVFDDSDNEDDISGNNTEKGREKGVEKGTMRGGDNNRKQMSTGEEELEGDDKRITAGVEGDLMAPIRAILAAQAVKEKAALARSEARASNNEGALLCAFCIVFYCILSYFVFIYFSSLCFLFIIFYYYLL